MNRKVKHYFSTSCPNIRDKLKKLLTCKYSKFGISLGVTPEPPHKQNT